MKGIIMTFTIATSLIAAQDTMYKYIDSFPEQVAQARAIGKTISVKNIPAHINGIVFAGMGGSGIAGQVVATTLAQELSIPVATVKGYALPNWVNKNTLVILLSYSGNTEETISCFHDAKVRNACIAGITSGGQLADLLEHDGYDCIRVPGGMQPRAALGYLSIPLYYYVFKFGLTCKTVFEMLDQVEAMLVKARDLYHASGIANNAYAIAQKLQGKLPLMYGISESTDVVATRWRAQLAENSKVFASMHVVPEMNHNELEAFTRSMNNKDVAIVWLLDEAVHGRIKKRQRICSDLMQPYAQTHIVVEVSGATFMERMFHALYLGDWVSYWLAQLNETDPLIIPMISALKENMQD
ncbi:MAG: bifunctional phosphoglucose/phosphomannose isomerase [Candidatus Babeliales bacterium]